MSIIEKIEAGHFVATDAQVEALAHDMYTTNAKVQRIDGVYLRVLIAGCQSQLGSATPKRRKSAGDIEAQMTVLEAIHERFYAAVLRGVTTPEIAADASLEPVERQRRSLERNRRSTFARTAKSTLVAYVKAGGDLRSVDVSKASKASLRGFAKPALMTAGAKLARAQTAFVAAATKCAEETPEQAKAILERAMAELRALLNSLDEEPANAAPEPRRARTVAGEAYIPGRAAR